MGHPVVFQLLILAGALSAAQGTVTAPLSKKPPAGAMAIVAAEGFPVQTLTIDQVRRIYLGEKLFLRKIRLKPLMNRDEEVTEMFFEKVMGMTAQMFKAHWLIKLFQEGVNPPETVDVAQLSIEQNRNPGALCYLRLDEIRSDAGLRVLLLLDIKGLR